MLGGRDIRLACGELGLGFGFGGGRRARGEGGAVGAGEDNLILKD